jgi:hypothetical protein
MVIHTGRRCLDESIMHKDMAELYAVHTIADGVERGNSIRESGIDMGAQAKYLWDCIWVR